MNIIFTSNNKAFENIGSPKLDYYNEIRDFSYPTNLVYGKTYYTERNGKLVAFKIHSAAVVNGDWQRCNCINPTNDFCHRLVYFIQYANMTQPIWEIDSLRYPCFESVEDYLNLKAVDFKRKSLGDLVNEVHKDVEVKRFSTSSDHIEINHTYCWSKCDGKPKAYGSMIDSVVFTNDGMIVCTNPKLNWQKQPINGFNTFEECMANHFNDMAIVDFETETISLNIQIEITKPSITKLKVVEFK